MLRAIKRLVMGPPKNVIVIIGTTGVGKSQFSIEIAKRFNGEIINADSMQMYKGADIITNKHPMQEREGIAHHVMNHVDWNEEYFIHRFQKEALSSIADIHSRGKIPIIIGGTHYYLNSLLFKNKTIKNDNPTTDKSEKLTEEQVKILDGPPDEVFKTLKQVDPITAEKFHPNDTRRVRRMLEIYYTTNKKASEHYEGQVEMEHYGSQLRFNTLAFWVYAQKPILDKRLNERVDKMLENGGMTEINELYYHYTNSESRPDIETGIWQVIGFKEFLPWLEGDKSDEELKNSIENMKTRTRQYAKRQVKWIKGLLAADLAKEEEHNYVNGGRLFLLDATDLSQWSSNVTQRGTEITGKFLEGKAFEIKQTPEGLGSLLGTETNKQEDKTTQWKHYICDKCFNKDNSPVIVVGDKQWRTHLSSNRHKSNINRGKRKREYAEWLSKQQDSNNNKQTTD